MTELVARIVRRLNALTDDELLELHREISRRAQDVYYRRYVGRHREGFAAAAFKRRVPAG